MGAAQQSLKFSLDDYMRWEAEQSERHEYINGEVFAMTGARDVHNTIALNIASTLRSALRGSPCRAFIADMKLRVDAVDAVFYPDVLVTCDARDKTPDADTAKQHPVLIVEVLSDSTSAYDRGLKFEHYRNIDTLREYLLVEQDRRHADLFRREDDGRWVLYASGAVDDVVLESVGLRLSMDTLFEDVVFESIAATAAPESTA
ncbi:MAG: Uma2 family endonuclease [Pseudomonadota bacterium]|nr:Uma2 family endonuclease [Pseudomonadota bacterium]